MAQITANGIPLEYDIHGPEGGEPLLLIMGLGVQMTRWPQEMVDDLAKRGYRVIRHDNRDVGLSHKFDAADVAQALAVRDAKIAELEAELAAEARTGRPARPMPFTGPAACRLPA